MSKGKKIAIIIAVIFIGVGILMAGAALVLTGFNFSKLNTRNYEVQKVEVDETFNNIEIEDVECDIQLAKSNDGICRVEFTATEGIEHNISVDNGLLKVTRIDTRKWYECIGIFSWEEMRVTVYLPEKEYDSLKLNTVSGNIIVPEEFIFVNAVASSTSGDVIMSYVEAEELFASSTSGDVELFSVIINGDADIKAVSGDIELEGCDAESFRIKTVSGDVDGEILTTKNFVTNTTSGNVRVPVSDYSAGECVIDTTSGDIEIEILGQK